ncbi:MAG TPA: helix-turn-helix domain-containing protein [Ohtaekwangia sp.]|uniref:helix-turn-helix domain-containing protein n=1 Tax=Ohtaekwangia sp. TaxID=2066019 RepID=UPI002F9291AC
MNRKGTQRPQKKYSRAEVAEGLIKPLRLSDKKMKEANAEMLKVLKNHRENLSSGERLKGQLLQLKFQIEDYLREESFDSERRLGYFLKAYIQSLNIKNIELARQIDIKASELSQYINDYRKPPENIFIRLEIHSHKIIPARDWYSLVLKEKLHTLNVNPSRWKAERKHVIEASLK